MYEYDKGEEVKKEVKEVEEINPNQSGAQKPVVKSNRKRNIAALLVVGGCLLFFWLTCVNPDGSKKHVPISDIIPVAPTPDTITSRDQSPTLPMMDAEDHIRDSIFDETCRELVKELVKKTLETILDEIKEEAEAGHWEKADDWYGRATDIMENGGKRGHALMRKYEAELARLKTTIVSKNPSAGSMPEAEKSDNAEEESSVAVAVVRNNTIYELTLYYTGTESRIVSILPGEFTEITLPKGVYNIVARVSAPNVREYYGTEMLGGYHYSSSFYISQGY